MCNLDEMYNEICDRYFPQFSAASWSVEDSTDSNGFCDRENQRLLIGRETADYSRRVLLIHEIAHAVSDDDHNERWQGEMTRVRDEALERGDNLLGQELDEHLAWVTQPDA